MARLAAGETRIEGGIEWFRIWGRDDEDCQCARCGSSAAWRDCWNCGGEGTAGHDCGEDCCACLYPEDNVPCDWCDAKGGAWHCVSGPEWCRENPLPGREQIRSTALRAEAWSD